MELENVSVNWLDWLALILVIVGGLNWGLVGIGEFMDTNLNLVDLIFGSMASLENAVYVVVGLASLYVIYLAFQLYDAS